jgi:hypothetical protein
LEFDYDDVNHERVDFAMGMIVDILNDHIEIEYGKEITNGMRNFGQQNGERKNYKQHQIGHNIH